MVRTTVVIEDDLYRKLVEESVKRYGSTRKLSKLINEKLRESKKPRPSELKLPRVKLGKKINWRFVEKTVEKMGTSWKE